MSCAAANFERTLNPALMKKIGQAPCVAARALSFLFSPGQAQLIITVLKTANDLLCQRRNVTYQSTALT